MSRTVPRWQPRSDIYVSRWASHDKNVFTEVAGLSGLATKMRSLGRCRLGSSNVGINDRIGWLMAHFERLRCLEIKRSTKYTKPKWFCSGVRVISWIAFCRAEKTKPN